MDIFQSTGFNPSVLKPVRAWSDFAQTASFRSPTNVAEAQSRLTHNLKYFQSNYLVVFAILLLYCLYCRPTGSPLICLPCRLTNILFLLGFVASAAGLLGLSRLPADYAYPVASHTLTARHLQLVWAVVSLLLLYATSAGSAIFWAVGVAAVIICAHAVMHDVAIESDFALPA